MIKKNNLLLGVSILGLTAMMAPQSVMAQTCNGVQNRTTQCVTSAGVAVADSYCTSNGLARPAVSQDCAYTCPPPPTVSYGGGDGGGGYGVDVNNDGVGDYSSQQSARSAGFSNGRSVNNHDNSYGQNAGTCGNCGDGGSSGGRVICTYFYLKGEVSKDYYFADFEYTLTRIHPNTVKGYHFWAVPYVDHLYKNPNGLLEALIRPVAVNRAEELAYQMGVRDKPNYLGKFFRALIEPLCFVVGSFVKETDYTKLYTKEYLDSAARVYRRHRVEKQQRDHGDPTSILF